MRIILLGPPGSGKGTQAKFIMEQYSIPQISAGDLLRTSVKSNSKLAREIQSLIKSGSLVPDKIVISLIKERIASKDCNQGFLLDGFPRTISQACTVKNFNINIDYVIEFSIPDELVIDRIIYRRVHLPSGISYNLKYNPPQITNKDNVSKEDFVIREDDKIEIIHKRLAEYHNVTAPLVHFYKKEAINGNIKYIRIDSTQPIKMVNLEIKKILG